MSRDHSAVAAALFNDADVLAGMAKALDRRADEADSAGRETLAAEQRHVAGVLRRMEQLLRSEGQRETVGITEIVIYRSEVADAIDREAERTAAIRASLTNTRYADDEPDFRGPSFVGPSHAPVTVWR